MKRCPKCNRTYTTDSQKFCTHDGVVLESVDVGLETIRTESAPVNDQDAPTKAISRELVSEVTGGFDPFKTVMSRPEGTVAGGPRNTQDLSSPSTTLEPTAPTPFATLPGSGQVSPTPPSQTSAPLPPAQSSPSAPTIPLTGSGPIVASPPLPQPQSAPLPPPPSAAPQDKKKSRLPLVLGILAVLLVLGGGVLVAGYFLVLPRILTARRAVEPPPPPATTPTPKVEATPGDIARNETNVASEPSPYSPPADAVEFVNKKENLDGKLAEHYVDFSFYYPERWEKDPKSGVPGAKNFVRVERRLSPNFPQEIFAAGWYVTTGAKETDQASYPRLVEERSSQLEKDYPEYHKVSEGPTKVGVYDGYEFRFESTSRNTDRGDIKVWGRVIFLPPVDGTKNGVTLLMLATSLASEMKTIDDVGVKGELPIMLQSFRFGKK